MTDQDVRTDVDISWNHLEFEVRYESLEQEVRIGLRAIGHIFLLILTINLGDHYLRLLLEEDPTNARIKNPVVFFNDLYHRFLLSLNTNMKAICLQVGMNPHSCLFEFKHFVEPSALKCRPCSIRSP